MFSSSALENMNSVSPELTWKPFAKGRRSQKSVARNFGTLKRLIDTLLSCSDKVDGSVRGQSTSRVKEKALERKRRQLDLRSSSMKLDLSTGFSEDNEQPLCPKYPSEDLSGIELLATVATMDDDFVKARWEDLPESSLVPRCSDAATSTSHSKELPKPNGLDSSLCDKTLLGGDSGFALVLPESAASSESLCRIPNENNTHKVNRQHWDLNIVMDAWVEPFGSNAIDIPLGEKQKDSEDQLLRNTNGKTDECPNPRTEDSESAVGRDNICCQLTYRKEDASSFAGECRDQITRVEADKRNNNQVLVWDSCLEPAKQVKMNEATAPDSSLLHKLDFSGTLMQVGQFVESTGTNAELQDEVFSSNVVLCAKTLACDKAHRNTQDLTVCDLPAIEASDSTIGVQCNDSKDCIMGSGRSHAPISMDNVIPCTLRSHSDDSKNNSDEAKLMVIPKQVDNIETKDEVKGNIMAGSRGKCIHPSVYVETNDLSVSDSPHYDQGHKVGDDVTRHVEMYDSSYEDGELRCSFLYTLEDNALENESINYESDGRYADDLSADDHAGYGVGGSEASHGSETGNLKENESVTRSSRHLVNNDLNDDPDNEVSGKGESNAGSGTTVDHSLDLIIEENDNCMKRRKVIDRRDLFARKSRDADGYPFKFAARLSYIDSLDRMNPYPVQSCRSNRYSDSVSHTTREDVTLERYRGRHRPIPHSERDQVGQSAHWPLKKRFTPRYQGAKDRGYSRPITSTTSTSGEFNRLNNGYYWKTTNNMPIGLRKPFIRKSPLRKDHSFGIHTRSPFGQGTSRFKSRGYHSQRAGREFGEQLEPQPEHDMARAPHLTRYSSMRERSFSPSPDTVARFNKRLRRSHSRSRTPPRRVLQSHKDQSLHNMKHGRSQDFRYKVRTGRPFSKSAFAPEYEDNYSSPSHRRFSPIRRWVDDRGSVRADNNIRHRRSPIRHLRSDHKVDSVGHYPLRRFSFKPNSGREGKFESKSNYGCDDNGEVKRRDNGGNLRSLGNVGDLEKGSLDNGK